MKEKEGLDRMTVLQSDVLDAWVRKAVEIGILRLGPRGKVVPGREDLEEVERTFAAPPVTDGEAAERWRLAQATAILRGARAAGMTR